MKCRVTTTSEDNFVCCAWHRDGTKFYVGGTRGQFLECVSPAVACCVKVGDYSMINSAGVVKYIVEG